MSTKPQNTVKLAKLYTTRNALSKQWLVYFTVPNPTTSKLTRRRVYDGFAQYSTIANRIKHGEKLILEINEKLKAGWNPYKEENGLITEFGAACAKRLISELFAALEENKHNLRSKSYSTYRSHLRGFKVFLSCKQLDNLLVSEFDKSHAQEFIKYLNLTKKVHPTTRNAYAVTIKTLF